MNAPAVVQLVTRLYAASGAREATEVDFEVYGDALDNTDDDVALQACRELCRNVDLVAHRPSPAMVREQVQAVLRRQQECRPAIPEDTGPPVPPEVAKEWLARIRDRHGGEPTQLGGLLADALPQQDGPV